VGHRKKRGQFYTLGVNAKKAREDINAAKNNPLSPGEGGGEHRALEKKQQGKKKKKKRKKKP